MSQSSQPNSRFDNAATTWDAETRRVQMARNIQDALLKSVELTPEMDILDFGCGTGLFSLDLRSRVRSLTGADTSLPMLEVFAQKGGAEVRTRHLEGLDLGGPYDLIMSSMALHHIRNLAPVFQAFHQALTPGGHLALADLDAEDGSFHGPSDDVFHLGFERRAIMEALAQAGFRDLTEKNAASIEKAGRSFPIFLITARRAQD